MTAQEHERERVVARRAGIGLALVQSGRSLLASAPGGLTALLLDPAP